jgi:Mrp family chromosome partitioning ATPase
MDGQRNDLGPTASEALLKAWSHRRILAAVVALSLIMVIGIGSRRSVTYVAFATVTLDPDPDRETSRWVRNQGLLISTDLVRQRARLRYPDLAQVRAESGGYLVEKISVQGVAPTPDVAVKTANAFAEAYSELSRIVLAEEIVNNRRVVAGQQAIVRQRLRELELALDREENPILRGRYQTELESWLALQTRVNKLGRDVEARSRRTSDVKLVDPAFGAVTSRGTSMPQLVFMGLLVGLLASIVLLSTVTSAGVAVTRLGEVASLSPANIAWAVPSDQAWSIRRSFRKRRPIRAATARAQSIDAIRNIRTAFTTFPDLGGRVNLVTSPQRNEGKSVIALLLAQSLGRTGKSVILIDAHLRAPKLHLLAGTRNTGVAELSGRHPNPRRSVQRIVGGVPFDVLCAGRSFRPSEHVTEVITAEWIVRLLGKYDYVVIDGPPLLAAAETRLLANLADVVTIVTRARQTTHEQIRKSNVLLDTIGAPRRMMVLNRATPGVVTVVRESLRQRRELLLSRRIAAGAK